MTRRTLIALTLLALTTGAAIGQVAPNVGQEAPEVGSLSWVVGKPAVESIEALRGEVILVERWGVRCPPCIRLIPHLEELHRNFAGKGLHIFAIESQNHTPEQIRAVLGGASYPVATNGAHAYRGPGSIPYAWVIGVDGQVKWQGNPGAGGMDEVLHAELQKVRYPGLGKSEVHPSVESAAGRFARGDLATARREAARVAGDEDADGEAVADARYLLDRIDGALAGRLEAARALEEDRRYAEAIEAYDLIGRDFKGIDEADAAADRVRELKRDRTVRRELEAARALEVLRSRIDPPRGRRPTPAQIEAGLEAFVRKYEGTRAAEDAARMLTSL